MFTIVMLYNILILYTSFLNNLLTLLYFQSFSYQKNRFLNVFAANPELSYP